MLMAGKWAHCVPSGSKIENYQNHGGTPQDSLLARLLWFAHFRTFGMERSSCLGYYMYVWT